MPSGDEVVRGSPFVLIVYRLAKVHPAVQTMGEPATLGWRMLAQLTSRVRGSDRNDVSEIHRVVTMVKRIMCAATLRQGAYPMQLVDLRQLTSRNWNRCWPKRRGSGNGS